VQFITEHDTVLARQLFICGAGGHGRVCAEVADAAGHQVAGFVDIVQPPQELINGKPVFVMTLRELAQAHDLDHIRLFVAIGDNEIRMKLLAEAQSLGFEVPALIHPSAIISPSCTIGKGSIAMAGVTVNANAQIGRGCILNTSCSLDHDNILMDGVQISPGVIAAGNVRFDEAAFVGTGTALKPGVTVGARAIVGAGTVVIRDVPSGARVAGNPARPLRS